MSINLSHDRIPELHKQEKLLADVFDNKTSGLATVLEAWSHIRVRTIQELKGKFSEQELYAIVDAYNGTIFEPRYSCDSQFLRIQIEDSIQYSGFSQDWKFKKDEFLTKIDSLTSAQTYFLLEEVQRFWNKESAKGNSLENFVKNLL